jgi:hypothetical protein
VDLGLEVDLDLQWRSNAYSTTTMLNGQKIVVVMPAYNAARTLRQTYEEVMAHGIVDLLSGTTAAKMRLSRSRARLIECGSSPMNRSYGANQDTTGTRLPPETSL